MIGPNTLSYNLSAKQIITRKALYTLGSSLYGVLKDGEAL